MLATVAKVATLWRNRREISRMPTRNISLTPEQDAFIDEMLTAGESGKPQGCMMWQKTIRHQARRRG